MTPDPWQALILDAWLARTEGDRFACESCGLSVPRQNGKNALLEMRELYGLCIIGEQILHSAHEVRTTNTSFRRLAQFFEDEDNHPEMHALVSRIRYTNGQEAIELTNGGLIRFCARSKNAARGMTFDVVVFDEAQELTDEQVDAMLPTMAASGLGNRQILYTGTPPSPMSAGTVFKRTRRVALEGEDPTLAWHEWGVEEPGDVTDRRRWYETNPALGIRLSEGFTEKELHTLSSDGFARERLGWWSPDAQGADHVISAEDWDACATADPPEDGVMCAAAKFSPDGSRVSLAVCLNPKEGTPYVEVVANKSTSSGTRWLADWLVGRRDKVASVAIDGRRGESVVQAIRDGGFPARFVSVPSSADMAKANALLVDRVQAREIRHYGQPDLDSAACGCVRRQIGADGFGFADTETADSTLIEACALALREALTTKRRPGRKAVVL